MIAHRCKNKRVLLLLLLCSSFMLQRVVAAMNGISEQCQTCMSLWEVSSTKPSKKKCKNKCSKEQEKDGGEMVLEPVCNKKKCCKTLCKYDEAHMACKKTKHCSKKEYNSIEELVPTQAPVTPSPTITSSPTIERCPKGRPSVLGNLGINTEFKFGERNDHRALRELVSICDGSYNPDNLPCPFGNIPMSCWDVTGVKSMKDVFHTKQHNEPLDLWNVSSVTDMEGMFSFAKKFNQPIGSWDVSNVRGFEWMFNNAEGYNQPLNTWVTSSATSMNYMFDECKKFNQPLDQWDTSSVHSISDMFSQAEKFNQDVNSWDVSSMTSLSFLFRSASAFNQCLSEWPNKVSFDFDGYNMFVGTKCSNQSTLSEPRVGPWCQTEADGCSFTLDPNA